MTTALTREIGAFVARVSFNDIPEDALNVAKMGTIDAVGTMMAGRSEPVVEILERCLRARTEPAEARLFMGRDRISADLAALLNGTAMHVLDYDDVALPLGGHPSTVLAPAIFAQADTQPDATGQDVLRAYVVGYEVWADLAMRESGAIHLKGWHPTSVLGVVAAAAACAALRGLSAEATTHAIGIAASESCGLAANFGSMTKSYHAGRAAQSGLLAARLAAAGMTASEDVLEHPRGLLFALSPEGEIDTQTPTDRLGREWQIVKHRVGIKKYPMCYAVHRAVDGLLDLRQQTAIDPNDVAKVSVEIGSTQATILRNSRPQTGLEAKFSIEFAMACALVAGRSGLAELTDEFVQRGDVQRLIASTEVMTNPEKSFTTDVFSPYDQVTLTLNNGETLQSAKVEMARGDSGLPLTRDELWTKFEDCLRVGGIGNNSARALFEAFDDVENLALACDLPTLGAD